MPIEAKILPIPLPTCFCVILNNSAEDKRKIVQIGDTSTKFHTLDPFQLGNNLR